MKIVLQRVVEARVKVNKKVVGEIGNGIVLLVGFAKDDQDSDFDWYIKKTLNLRIFPDQYGKMNKSIFDIEGEVLIVSQFTLLGNCKKGRRPSYDKAASSEQAKKLYEIFIKKYKKAYKKVQTGEFQAKMQVELINDGPVTLIV